MSGILKEREDSGQKRDANNYRKRDAFQQIGGEDARRGLIKAETRLNHERVVDAERQRQQRFGNHKQADIRNSRRNRMPAPAARDAVQAFVVGVVADGPIDASAGAAQATACMAMQELEQAWGRLQTGIALRYPKAEPTPVRMRDARGREAAFDPSQVAAYVADGWEVI